MIWKEYPEGLSLGETGRSPGPITRLHSTSLLPNLEVTLSRETYRFPLFSLVAQSLQLSSLVICKLSIWKESSIQIFLSCWGIDFSWCCHCWVLYDEISSYLWNFFTLKKELVIIYFSSWQFSGILNWKQLNDLIQYDSLSQKGID